MNHINAVKSDNNASNLEWCTPKQNMEHAAKNKLITRKCQKGLRLGIPMPQNNKKVSCFDITGNFLESFNSINEASAKMKVIHSKISAVCKGKRNSTGGYKFKYS